MQALDHISDDKKCGLTYLTILRKGGDMSHKNKQTLRAQANERFKKIFTPGMSKHDAKQQARENFYQHQDEFRVAGLNEKQAVDAELRKHIYSYNTYDSYMKHTGYFVDWCKENYHCKTLEQCREHADEWLQNRTAEGKSAYTLKLERASLAKVYDEPATNFFQTPERNRANITRSRDTAQRDYGFSVERHADIINFERATGLRRSELSKVSGADLRYMDDGTPALYVKGKGGRERLAPIIGEHQSEIVERCEAAGNNRIWASVPSHMDVHSYRAQYATAIYRAYARPVSEIPYNERYYCRGEDKGTVYDKQALLEASHALGHNRVSVVAEHYIRW